jgi:Helicase HerA, central domain
MAELRKRWIVERRQHEDAPWPYYVSSPWLREVPDAAWSALVQVLAASPQPVVLSIGLVPLHVPPRLSATISERAATFRRLAEPGTSEATGLFRDPVPVAADPGALTAGQIFEDAGQRYQDRVFRLRIAIASEGALPPDLVTLVREVMSPAEAGDVRGFRAAALIATALTAVTPRTQSEIDAFRSNLEGLGHLPWGEPAVPSPDVLPYLAEVRQLGEIVDVREATAVFRFPVAPDGTYEGFPVVRPRDKVRVELDRRSPNDIVLGAQGHGASLDSVTVGLSSLTSHILVVGSTGSGKTSSVLNLLEQAWGTHGTPFLVIEPVNSDRDDYRWLLQRSGFESMIVFTIGDESPAPFRLNPFEVPAGVRIGTHLASLVACFDAAFGLTGPLPFLYRKAIKEVYTRAGISPDELSGPRHAGRWPRLRDLAEVFATLPDIDRYAGEVRSNISAASRLRAELLLTGSCGRTLDAVSSYPIEALLDRPVVLELAAVGDDDREQALVIALLLNSLTAYYKATRKSSALAHLTVIEEAHRLLRGPRPTGDDEGGGQAAGPLSSSPTRSPRTASTARAW